MLSPGSEITLVIEKPAAGGRMIARDDGRVVLVTGAIPGERVRARVERIGRGVAYAAVVDVLAADADRRPPGGDWRCGGQLYAHIAYERQRTLKAEILADAFARIGHLTVPGPVAVAASPERGYRMRARLHVRGSRLGFFREGSHDLCDATRTGQFLPETGKVIGRFTTAMRAAAIAGITGVELAENVPANERVLHLELDRPAERSRLSRLAGVAGLTGLTSSYGRSTRLDAVGGTPYVTDVLDVASRVFRADEDAAGSSDMPAGPVEARLRHHARGFFQGNRYLLPRLVSSVLGAVAPGPVTDLYAGAGLFAVCLAAAGWPQIDAVESNRASAADLRANAEQYGPTVKVVDAPVEEYLRARSPGGAATFIVDPPRTGLSRLVLEGVLGCNASRVVYVSCDVATLARDVRRFVDAGYLLERVEAFDFFPNTPHLESLALLAKRG